MVITEKSWILCHLALLKRQIHHLAHSLFRSAPNTLKIRFSGKSSILCHSRDTLETLNSQLGTFSITVYTQDINVHFAAKSGTQSHLPLFTRQIHHLGNSLSVHPKTIKISCTGKSSIPRQFAVVNFQIHKLPHSISLCNQNCKNRSYSHILDSIAFTTFKMRNSQFCTFYISVLGYFVKSLLQEDIRCFFFYHRSNINFPLFKLYLTLHTKFRILSM